MDWLSFSKDLCKQQALSFSSAEENEEAMQQLGICQDVIQLGKGAFDCRIAEANYSRVSLLSDRVNTAVSSYLEPPVNTACIIFPRSMDSVMKVCGYDACNQSLIILPAKTALDLVTLGMAGTDSLLLSQETFRHFLRLVDSEACLFHTPSIIVDSQKQFQHWQYLITRMINKPDGYDDNDVEQLLYGVCESICFNRGLASTDYPKARLKRIQLAKATQAFLHDHYREKMTMDRLYLAFGISIRTLQRSFKEYFGLNIFSYLQAIRFNAVYRDIKQVTSSEIKVSDIALNHGFTHLGRFSTKFKYHFGFAAGNLP